MNLRFHSFYFFPKFALKIETFFIAQIEMVRLETASGSNETTNA